MHKNILWIEDDYFAIKGLIRPLEKAGFAIDIATSAFEGYQKAQHWTTYDLIMVDLILPARAGDQALPEPVASWQSEAHLGIGLLKWLLTELAVQCPVMLLSVVRHPTQTYGLENLGLAGYLPKRGLLPSHVREEVFRLLRLHS